MKKRLLNLSCLFLALSSYSQTFSEISENNVNDDGTGYTFEYNKSTNPSITSDSINCLDSRHNGHGASFSYNENYESVLYSTRSLSDLATHLINY